MRDPLIRLLSELPSTEPDSARTAHIRMRCHARLARTRPGESATHATAARDRTSQLWQPLLTALGVVYLTEVIVQALRVFRAP
jgi:hypothetical protein